jgi:hypothetical protein
MIQGFSSGLIGNRELIYETDLPSFQRDFAALKTLDHGTGPAITFTRASGATFFDANGVLQTAANDTPRFDHDPVTGESRGLLIEESRTNLLTHSADAANAAWGQVRLSVTANAAASPDGTTTAEKIVENTDNNSHRIAAPSVSYVSGTTYTFSVFLKAAERSQAYLAMHQSNTGTAFSTNPSLLVNLTTGATSGVTASVTASSVTSVGSGWWRVSISATATSSLTNQPSIFMADNTGQSAYTGDGTSGLFIWGAQLEAGAFPTSYIPTTTAAATRAADSAVVTPISSFYNQAEGTLFAESRIYADAASIVAVQIDTNTGSVIDNRLVIGAELGNSVQIAAASSGGAGQFAVTANLAAGTHKISVAFAPSNFAASLNGGSVTTGSSGVLPAALTHMRIGNNSASSNTLHIRKVAYWPKRLSNTLLQQLTT